MTPKKATRANTQSAPLVRASISFPPDLYETLEALAKQKKVSLAWVVRDATEKYIEGEANNGSVGRLPNSGQRTARRTDK
jgi:hypothetical protein